MSCSHSLRTDHPSRLSFLLYLLSRLMLFSILSCQYFFAGFFFSPYLYPCQKSPSQKIAILFLLCAKSGLPYISGCISNLYPVSLRTFFIFSISITFCLHIKRNSFAIMTVAQTVEYCFVSQVIPYR